MKTIQAADLVPVNVLINISRRVATRAYMIAMEKNVPIRSSGEIVIEPPKITQNQIAINIKLSNSRIAAYEWGSGIHKTRGTKGTYSINAKNKPNLVFEGTNAFEGQTIVTPHVDHPGVAPRPFLEPAKKQTRKENLDDLREANVQNMRLIIRGMARKV